MITTERTIIGDERVAEIHDERGSSLNAAIHRLTPEQAVVALMWLAGAHPESTAKAIDPDRVALSRRRRRPGRAAGGVSNDAAHDPER